MSDRSWQCTIFGALRHPDRPEALFLDGPDGFRLPFFEAENVWSSMMGKFTPEFCRLYGTNVWGLRRLHSRPDQDAHTLAAVVELSLLDRAWTPPKGLTWLGPDEIRETGLDDDLRAAVIASLEEVGVHPLRPGWARPGWIDEARAWIETAVRAAGMQVTEIAQVKQWGISCVLRVATGVSEYFFKATNRNMTLFVNEAATTDQLADRFPAYVIRPFGLNIEQDWMLLPAFTAPFFEKNNLETRLPDLFRRFAALQIASIESVGDLARAGLLDRRLNRLRMQVDVLLDDETALKRLEEKEREEVRSLRPVFHELIERLASLGIPDTLVHGDLHPGNAAYVDDRVVFFDWTDACISHPFFDLFSLSDFDEETAVAALNAYLDPWRTVMPEATLQAAVPLARALLLLHHAVSYREIVANLEPVSKSELDFTHLILQDAVRAVNALR